MIYAIAAMIVIGVVAVLSVDTIARKVAERRVRAETGMEATIENFRIGFASSSVHIQNFVLKNTAEFGGGPFVEMPELYVEYDRNALRSGILRLKVVRINVASIHVVENKDGRRNVDGLQQQPGKIKQAGISTNKTGSPLIFAGVDKLDVTLRTAKFTSYRAPDQNMEQDLGIRDERFNNLKTDMDFQTAAAVLALKAGANFLFAGDLKNLGMIFKSSSKHAKKPKRIAGDPATPVGKN